jgi:hypothetical protein
VKALPRVVGRKPEEGETHEGKGWVARLNPVRFITDSGTEQSLEGEARKLGVGGNIYRATSATTRRQRFIDEVGRLCSGSKPLKSEPWTWQWGEINPQGHLRRKAARA